MDTTPAPAATRVFVAHYTRSEDGVIVASRARRLHAPHEDAAIAVAQQQRAGFALYSVRPATDRDAQAWL